MKFLYPYNKIFITGIPTAGKTHLAKVVAKKVHGIHVDTDEIRHVLRRNPKYKKWVDWYWNQDEYKYYTSTSYQQQWRNLVRQSKKIWPGMMAGICKYNREKRPIIFEGVSLLPHLVKKHLPFKGVVIIGKSKKDVLVRLLKHHRWGRTLTLKQLEADAFFNGERPRYRAEAKKYGYKVFTTADKALRTVLKMVRK